MTKKAITPIFLIYGSQHLSDRNIGDDVVNEDIWDTYIHYPGCRMAVNRMNSAMFHNGFTHDLDAERRQQLMIGSVYKDLFGFSCVVKKGDNIQSWPPLTNGIGFELYQFDDELPICTKIRITSQPTIGDIPGKQVFVDRADPENGIYDGFYLLRSIYGPPGERGLSLVIHLIDIFRTQKDVLDVYGGYARLHDVAHPLYKIKNYDTNRNSAVEAEIKDVKKGEAIIIDLENEMDYKSPEAGAWDPVPVLNKYDEMIAREGSLNKHMLTGDPEGYLTSSITATANWYAWVMEQQEILFPQIKPILIALGASHDVQFNSPEEYSLEQMANGIKILRDALEGLAPREQIIDMINDKFGLKDDKKLKLAPEEELINLKGDDQDNEFRQSGTTE